MENPAESFNVQNIFTVIHSLDLLADQFSHLLMKYLKSTVLEKQKKLGVQYIIVPPPSAWQTF